jgi:aspartyl-tRNA synthetase
VFFVLGRPEKMYKFAGEARVKIGLDLNLTQLDQYKLCWIVDFPFYEWSEEEKKFDFAHNPFSMPQGGRMRCSRAGPARHQGLPVRRRVQRLRDRLGLDP